MNDCQHDPLYRLENEASGGIGCPICNRQRIEAQRQRNEQAAPVPGRFVNQQVTLDEIAEMEARCAEQHQDAPQHEGMWK
jgi:hypothetical protein